MVSPDMAFPSLGALIWEPSGALLSGLALAALFAGVVWPSLPILACQFMVVVCVFRTTVRIPSCMMLLDIVGMFLSVAGALGFGKIHCSILILGSGLICPLPLL